MSNMRKPLTYLDRKRRKNNNYYFISYAHSDSEKVYETLNKLYDAGLNYWYDVEFDDGDVWTEEAKKVLNNNNCVGVIFFLSFNSIASKAVADEASEVLKIKREDNSFSVLPIVVEDNSDIIFRIIMNSKNDLNTLFANNERIYNNINSPDLMDKLIKVFAKKNATENIDDYIRGSKLTTLVDDYIYEFGNYYFDNKDEKKPIKWKVVKREKNLTYLVSVYAIDFVTERLIKNKVLEIKQSLDNIGDMIELFDIIDEDIIDDKNRFGETIPTDYADSQRSQFLRLFWVKSRNGLYKTYNCNNVEVKHNLDLNKINCGIRLLLVIDENKWR